MAEAKTRPTMLWDTLKLSAEPLRGRSDIRVAARVKVQRSDQTGYDVK
jgi:hypothetical protein